MSNGFVAAPKFFNAMDELLQHPECPKDTFTSINSVVDSANETGYVTASQAFHAGAAYKLIVNGGKYIRHDWWH